MIVTMVMPVVMSTVVCVAVVVRHVYEHIMIKGARLEGRRGCHIRSESHFRTLPWLAGKHHWILKFDDIANDGMIDHGQFLLAL